MKHSFCLLTLLFTGHFSFAQMGAVGRISNVLTGIQLGMSQADFYLLKKQVDPPDNTMIFRFEATENINADGIKSITYYFDADGNKPLYEFIIEFADNATMNATAANMFGPGNYPNKPGYWLLGAQDNIVSLGWAFDNSIVVAANFPGSEWTGDPDFVVPDGFSPFAHIASPTEWSLQDKTMFWTSLENQIVAGAKHFESIRGGSTDDSPNHFQCTATVHGAEQGFVFKNDDEKWTVSNTMVSALSTNAANDWKNELADMLDKQQPEHYRLLPAGSKPMFGSTVDLWDVMDLQGQKTGFVIGVVQYEWDAEGLWNIDLVLMEE